MEKSSDYKLVFEDEDNILFQEIESKRVLKFIILTILGLFCIWPIFIEECRNTTGLVWISLTVGAFLLFSGTFTILSRGYIKIDRSKKIIEYFVGKQKYLFKSKLIPFNKVDGVLVKNVIHASPIGRAPDSIAIQLYVRDSSNVIINNTFDEMYADQLTAKLCDFIGCRAYSINE